MSTLKKMLGKRIRELRKSHGITQEQLAEMLGIGTANISYIENGKFAPSFENFEKLTHIFKIEPYELYKFKQCYSKEYILRELFSALEKDDALLNIVYNFYKAIK